MPDELTELGWHERFKVQAKWTEKLRQFLYQQVGISKDSRLLEVGCGTGVIISELARVYSNPTHGVDISIDRLKLANELDHHSRYACANVLNLPFSDNSFDFVISHYFLLWIQNPHAALAEMKRVLVPGGTVLTLAEPDHGSRIDYPIKFENLGKNQTRSLINQGADATFGRKLPSLYSDAGLQDIQFGVPGFQTEVTTLPEWWESEWEIVKADLSDTMTEKELNLLKKQDADSRINGSRVLWVPTFYAYGKK
jgi:ubiquinone/menaquinone biosynthesis C-methylase UbiE